MSTIISIILKKRINEENVMCEKITVEDVIKYYYDRGDNIPIIREININRETKKYAYITKNGDGFEGKIMDEKSARIELDNILQQQKEYNLSYLLGLFIIGYGEKNSAYINLMRKFIELKNTTIVPNSNSTDDEIFAFLIKYIKKNGMKNEFSSLKIFKNYKEMEKWIFKEEVDFDQRWHLIVSYIMYMELNGIYNFSATKKMTDLKNTDFKECYSKLRCCELYLWMLIEANLDEAKIISELKKLIEERKQGRRATIKDRVSWEDVSKKIKNNCR